MISGCRSSPGRAQLLKNRASRSPSKDSVSFMTCMARQNPLRFADSRLKTSQCSQSCRAGGLSCAQFIDPLLSWRWNHMKSYLKTASPFKWFFPTLSFFPECVARVAVSLWGSGWGCVRSTLRLRPQPSATVCNRPQPFATVEGRMAMPCHAYGKFCQRGHFWKFQLSRCCVSRAWQARHFVAFRRVSWLVESRFVWQPQYFCDVFRRCVAFFPAGATLWRPSSWFCVAGAAL